MKRRFLSLKMIHQLVGSSNLDDYLIVLESANSNLFLNEIKHRKNKFQLI